MIDLLVTMAGVSSALKSASEITKTILETRDDAIRRAKVIELQGQILSAQASALSAQADQFALLKRVSDLEKEIADVEAWDAEKQRYRLEGIDGKAFVYALKLDMSKGEPAHWICAHCYTDGKKEVLQQSDFVVPPNPNQRKWTCARCKAAMQTHYLAKPSFVETTGEQIEGH